jgi:hypothetical protein
MELVIGNKNCSSWSMRPGVLMRGPAMPFEERKLSFKLGLGAGFAAAVRAFSPAGRRLCGAAARRARPRSVDRRRAGGARVGARGRALAHAALSARAAPAA